MKITCVIRVTVFILLAFGSRWAHAQVDEYLLKAIYLEKFTRFIEWPQQAQRDTFYLQVLGDNPFDTTLNKIYAQRPIQGKPVELKFTQSPDNLRFCHLLFIASSEKHHLPEIIQQLKGKAVLTVSDTENFARHGIIINFYTVKNKLRFEINPEALSSAGLNVDFRLLNAARIVQPKTE